MSNYSFNSSNFSNSNPSFKQPYKAPEFKIGTSKLKFAPKAPPSLAPLATKTTAISTSSLLTFAPPINTLKPLPKLTISKPPSVNPSQTLDKLPTNVPKLIELFNPETMLNNAIATSLKSEMIGTGMEASFGRGVATVTAPYLKKACAVHPAVQKVCDGTVAVVSITVEFISHKMVPPEKEPLRQKNIRSDAEFYRKQYGIPKEDTVQWHQDMKEVATGKIFSYGLMTGGMLLKNFSKLKMTIPRGLNAYSPDTGTLTIRPNVGSASATSKKRIEFVNGRDLASKLDYLEKYYKANNIPHLLDIEVYAKGELFLNIKRDFRAAATAAKKQTAKAAAKTQTAVSTALIQLPAPAQKLLPAPQVLAAPAQASQIARIGPIKQPKQDQLTQAKNKTANLNKQTSTLSVSNKKPYLKLIWDKNNPPKPVKMEPPSRPLKLKAPKIATVTRIGSEHIPNQELIAIANRINLFHQLASGNKPKLTQLSSQPQIPPVSPPKFHAVPIENKTITVKHYLSPIKLDVTLQKGADNTLNIWVHSLKMRHSVSKEFVTTNYRTDSIMFSTIDSFVNLARRQKASSIVIQWVLTLEDIQHAASNLKQLQVTGRPNILSKLVTPTPPPLELTVYPQAHPIKTVLSVVRKPLNLIGKAFMRVTDLDFKAMSTTSFSFIGPPVFTPAKTLKSKATEKLSKKMDELIKKDPGPTMHDSIEYNLKKIVKYLPDYTHVGSEHKIIKLIMDQFDASEQLPTIKPYKNERTNGVYHISRGEASYVIRKADDPQYLLNEKVAFDLLESWNLNHLELAKPIAIGKFRTIYFLGRTDLIGPTLYKGMEDLAEASVDAGKTGQLLSQCVVDHHKVGQVFGEIYRKSIQYNQQMPQTEIDKLVGGVAYKHNRINAFLRANGYPTLVDSEIFIAPLVTVLQQNPLYYTHAIHDIHPGHFVRLNNGKLGLFDAEEMAFSFDSQYNPITKPLHDYFVYSEQLHIEGTKLKLTFEQIRLMQEAVKLGMISEGVPLETIDVLIQLHMLDKSLERMKACIGINNQLLSPNLINYAKTFNKIAEKPKPNEPVVIGTNEIPASWYKQEGELAELKRGSYVVVKDEKGIYLSFHIDGLYANGTQNVVKKIYNNIFNEALTRNADRLYGVTEFRNKALLQHLTTKYGLKFIEECGKDSIYEIPFSKGYHYADALAQSSLVVPARIQRGISITRVQSEDIPKYKDAMREVYKDGAQELINEHQWEWFDPSHSHGKESRTRILAARDIHKTGSPPVGFIELLREGAHVTIQLLHVDKTQRGKGIGTLLLSYAYYFAKEYNCQSMGFYAEAAGHRLYQTLGFGIYKLDPKLWKKLAPSEKLLAFVHTDMPLTIELSDLRSVEQFEKRLSEVLGSDNTHLPPKKLNPAPFLPPFAKEWDCWDPQNPPVFKERPSYNPTTSVAKAKRIFEFKREMIYRVLLPEEQKRYENYWKKFAPVQSTPYSTYRRYYPNGDVMQVTAYDKFGNKECQYDFPHREGVESHKHPYYYNEANPRPLGVHGPHISMDRALYIAPAKNKLHFNGSEQEIRNALKDYSGRGKNPQLVFAQDVLSSNGMDIKIQNMEVLVSTFQKGMYNSVFLINQNDLPALVIKDLFSLTTPERGLIDEVRATDILQGLSLTRAKIVTVKGTGKYIDEKKMEKGLIAYSYAAGTGITSMIADLKQLPVNSVERITALSELSSVMVYAVEALAELHLKGNETARQVSSTYLEGKTKKLKLMAKSSIEELNRRGYDVETIQETLKALLARKPNPGTAGYVHGDAWPSNFLWDKQTSTLSMIDVGTLTTSIDQFKQPIGMPAMDFQQFLASTEALGVYYGLVENEISTLCQAITQSYAQMMVISNEYAQQFAYLYWFFYRVQVLTADGGAQKTKELDKLMDRFALSP